MSAASFTPLSLRSTCGKPSDKVKVVKKFRNDAQKQASMGAPAKADALTYPVKLDFQVNEGSEVQIIIFWREIGGELEIYSGQPEYNWDTEEIEFNMNSAEGTFHTLAWGYCEGLDGTLVIYDDAFTFAQGGTFTVKESDAVKRTDIKRIGPKGTELSLPTYEGEGGNCMVGDAMNMVFLDDELFFYGDVTLFSDGQHYFKTNGWPANMKVIRYQSMCDAESGSMSMIIPVDYNKSEVGSTASGWQSAAFSFAETPFNVNYKAMAAEAGVEESYSFYQTYFLNGEKWFGTHGLGVDGDGANKSTNKVNLWQPADFNFPMHTALQPSGDVFAGPNSGVLGMPMTYNPNGTKPVLQAINTTFDLSLAADPDNLNWFDGGNSVMIIPDDAKLANCAPSLVVVPSFGKFKYSFNGRHGESFGIDAFNILENIDDPEVAEMLGAPTSHVSVTMNGEVVINDISQLESGDGWLDNTPFTAEIYTDNILIDETLKGRTSGTLSFNPKTSEYMPSVTNVRFTNAAGKVTDRLASAADGTIGVYASCMASDVDMNLLMEYCTYDIPGAVRAEWAPFKADHSYAADGWKALDLKADHSKDYLPGWGSYYDASLATVTDLAPEGWYAVRITVESADGAGSLQQVISPAFQIPSQASVKGVSAVDNDIVPVYYSLDGVRIDRPTSGMYIEVRGGNARKVMLR